MKKILLSTGGSGGHVIPALSIFDHLKKRYNISIITDHRGSKFINKNNYNYQLFYVPKISYNILKFPISIFFLFLSIIKSLIYLKKNNIEILISTGGYMSLPFCISGKFLGIKIILFEPNMVIGRSNKLILPYSKKIICYSKNIKNFPKKYCKKIFLISPILQKKIYSLNKKNKNLTKKIILLVLGGSQGAEFFDKFVKKIILKLSKKASIKIYQQVSNEEKVGELKSIYKKNNIESDIFTFDSEIQKKISYCNFAITRCGASTLSELTYLNIPFIGIPFPYAKDNHQYYNAIHYENYNCCWIYSQNKIKEDEILNLFQKITVNNKIYNEKLQNMKKISYENDWNNINKKLTNLINEY
tara:strand:- start:3331 stop:4404 length:1074 start_codon:yes stop_codon:yes gene_type:complete